MFYLDNGATNLAATLLGFSQCRLYDLRGFPPRRRTYYIRKRGNPSMIQVRHVVPPLIIAAILLSGCSPWSTINDNLQPMRGQPVDALFMKLGYPQSEGTVAGRYFYIWQAGGTVFIPETSTTTGYGMAGSQPFNYTETTFSGGSPMALHCSLRVFVDNDNKITSWDGGGNNGACLNFVDRLSK
jgi:hypothetical protein